MHRPTIHPADQGVAPHACVHVHVLAVTAALCLRCGSAQPGHGGRRLSCPVTPQGRGAAAGMRWGLTPVSLQALTDLQAYGLIPVTRVESAPHRPSAPPSFLTLALFWTAHGRRLQLHEHNPCASGQCMCHIRPPDGMGMEPVRGQHVDGPAAACDGNPHAHASQRPCLQPQPAQAGECRTCLSVWVPGPCCCHMHPPPGWTTSPPAHMRLPCCHSTGREAARPGSPSRQPSILALPFSNCEETGSQRRFHAFVVVWAVLSRQQVRVILAGWGRWIALQWWCMAV